MSKRLSALVILGACTALLILPATGSARVAPTISTSRAKSLSIQALNQKTNFGKSTKKQVACSTGSSCSVSWKKGNQAYTGNTQLAIAVDATAQNYVFYIQYTIIRHSIACGTSNHCIKPAYSGSVSLPTGVPTEF
jgi:hypothetical protein